MVVVKYTCGIDVDGPITAESFAEKIKSVLDDDRGWRKYGYEFIYEPTRSSPKTLKIILVSGEKAKNKCGSRLGGFSCYSPDENNIYINLNNWMGGSASSLPLERYRTYAINHEVGHRLGMGHPSETNCSNSKFCNANKGSPGSVMIQMTRGPEWVSPCIENEWPLDPEIYNEILENPRLNNRYVVPVPAQYSGGNESSSNIIFALLILIIILIISIAEKIIPVITSSVSQLLGP